MSRNVYGAGNNGQGVDKANTFEDNFPVRNPESGKKVAKQGSQGNILQMPV